jgi:phage baseplate assembly protein W
MPPSPKRLASRRTATIDTLRVSTDTEISVVPDNEQHVLDCIRQMLFTTPGERVMLPEMG